MTGICGLPSLILKSWRGRTTIAGAIHCGLRRSISPLCAGALATACVIGIGRRRGATMPHAIPITRENAVQFRNRTPAWCHHATTISNLRCCSIALCVARSCFMVAERRYIADRSLLSMPRTMPGNCMRTLLRANSLAPCCACYATDSMQAGGAALLMHAADF